jgi:hypothetical protein
MLNIPPQESSIKTTIRTWIALRILPPFAYSLANNAVVCPAVFYLAEQMKRRLGR